MVEQKDYMESKVPQLPEFELVLGKKIANVGKSISLWDFRKIGEAYGFDLEEAICGVKLHLNGKSEDVATAIFRDKIDRQKLAIFYHDKNGQALYSVKQYRQ